MGEVLLNHSSLVDANVNHLIGQTGKLVSKVGRNFNALFRDRKEIQVNNTGLNHLCFVSSLPPGHLRVGPVQAQGQAGHAPSLPHQEGAAAVVRHHREEQPPQHGVRGSRPCDRGVLNLPSDSRM